MVKNESGENFLGKLYEKRQEKDASDFKKLNFRWLKMLLIWVFLSVRNFSIEFNTELWEHRSQKWQTPSSLEESFVVQTKSIFHVNLSFLPIEWK